MFTPPQHPDIDATLPDRLRGSPTVASHAERVLIVDDVPDNLALLHDALDESGYTVLVAISGEAALRIAAELPPDVVVLDAMMPGIDGFEVARRLKADPATAAEIDRLVGVPEDLQGRLDGRTG